jgi:hypothetical protein
VEKEGACGASVAIAGNIDVMEELKKSALSVFLNGGKKSVKHVLSECEMILLYA